MLDRSRKDQIQSSPLPECGTGGSWSWRHSSFTDESQDVRTENLPDYFNDLNAMHEAEKFLTTEQKAMYAIILAAECKGTEESEFILNPSLFSTATKRVEAFGRVLNLW